MHARLTCGPGCVKQLYTRQRRQKLAEQASRPSSNVCPAPGCPAGAAAALGGVASGGCPGFLSSRKPSSRAFTTPAVSGVSVRPSANR
jgi:hypothetical protein